MASKVNDADEGSILGVPTPQKTTCRGPRIVNNSRESEEKLPEKYAMLGEFFECMEISVRFFVLCKKLCIFSSISQKVEEMTKRQFKHAHLAQIKYILPEALQLEKTLTHDDNTLCMKLDLRITVLPIVLQNDIGPQDGLGSITNKAVLRKTFYTRLLEFANSHPDGDDVPQARLPEPFNLKCLPNNDIRRAALFSVTIGGKALTISGSREDLDTVVTRESPDLSVNPADTVLHIKQKDFQPTITVSHLPSNFKRHFSQGAGPGVVPAGLPSSIGLADDPASAPFSIEQKPYFVANSCSAEISEEDHELINSDEFDHFLSTSNAVSYLSPTSKACASPKVLQSETPVNASPLKSASVGEDEDDVFTTTPFKIPSLAHISSPISGGQFQARASKAGTKQCFSPSTPVVNSDSNDFSTPVAAGTSAHKVLISKSALKSHPRRQRIKKSLQYGVAPTQPFTPDPPASFVSPGIPAFGTPGTAAVVPSGLTASESSKVKKILDFEIPSIKSLPSNSVEKPLICFSALKRKATEARFDGSPVDESPSDTLRTMSHMPLTPVVSDEKANYSVDSAEPYHLRKPTNPFARQEEGTSMVRLLPFESPIKSSSPQKTQGEKTPMKEFFRNFIVHTPKRSRFSADEAAVKEVRASVSSNCVRALSFSSPSKKDVGICKLDSEIVPKFSDQVQRQDKVGGTEVAGSFKGSTDVSPSNLETIGCNPENLQLVKVRREDLANCKMIALPAPKTRQHIIACLPELFTTIFSIFQSVKRRVMTHQELVHKIILCQYDITDREEVEQQLQLLEELVPDWISKKTAISGDLLYGIQKYTDLQGIHTRLTEAI